MSRASSPPTRRRQRAAGPPRDEPRLHEHLGRRRARVGDPGEESFAGAAPDLDAAVVDAGQPDVPRRRERGVVVAHDRHVLGDAQPALGELGQGTEGHHVVRREHRRDVGVRVEQLRDRAGTGLLGGLAGEHDRGDLGAAVDPGPEADPPFVGRGRRGPDEPESSVPEAEQVLRGHRAARAVVVRDGVGTGDRDAATGDDERCGGRDGQVGVGLTGDHEPLDAHRQEALDGRGVEPGVEEAVGDDEPVALVLQRLAEAGQQVDEPLVPEVVEDDADRPGARARERDRGRGGAVVELLDRLEHRITPLLAHPRGALQDERHEGLRDPGARGDVVDGRGFAGSHDLHRPPWLSRRW